MRELIPIVAVLVSNAAMAQQAEFEVGPLIQVGVQNSDCVPPEARAEIEERVGVWRAAFRPFVAPTDAPPLYPFYPHAARLFDDGLFTNFVDIDPAGGVFKDFLCSQIAYDGHGGHDNIIRTWAEQDIGVPVYAALDGVVMFSQDGQFDKNTFCNGAGNYLVIDHGNGREGWYFHLRNGSVVGGPGTVVTKGQQIGLTASSGCSTYPHLHFESRQDGAVFEPFAGACRPGDSGWVSQPAMEWYPEIYDFWASTSHPNSTGGLPNPPPGDAEVLVSASLAYFPVMFTALPAFSTWRVQLERPNGTIGYDSGTVAFNNSTFFRFAYTWWQFNVFNVQGITGTWVFRMDINGQRLIDAPVRVVSSLTPGFNRAPEAIGVALEPSSPATGDAVFCHVSNPSPIDDLDWDTVRYRYVWKVDGAVVRDVVSAGRSDAIPRDSGSAGDTIECCVTPSDGTLDGATACAAGAYAGACYADCEGDGDLDVFDFLCFQGAFATQAVYADCEDDGDWDVFDFLCFQGQFAGGC